MLRNVLASAAGFDPCLCRVFWLRFSSFSLPNIKPVKPNLLNKYICEPNPPKLGKPASQNVVLKSLNLIWVDADNLSASV